MFGWLTERRRRKILSHPFPEHWRGHIEANVSYWKLLTDTERTHLEQMTQVFIAEKQWQGCGGLELDDEIRVTIASQACIMLLGRDHSLFNDVESILVYPSTVVLPARKRGIFEAPSAVLEGDRAVLGVAHLHGPVVLVWDAVRHGAHDPEDGHNVVFHEFAHKIDMLDGGADGTPPLEDSVHVQRWAEVCARAYLALKDKVEHHRRTFLDPYGATNEAEFFAVATEAFFERGEQMLNAMPELYALLADYFRQDPAERVRNSIPG